MDNSDIPKKIGRLYPVFQDDLWYTEHYLAKEFFNTGISTTFITSNKYRTSWLKYIKKAYPAGEFKFEYYDVVRLPSFFPFEQVIFCNPIKLFKLLFRSNFSVLHVYGFGTLVTFQFFILSLFAGNDCPPIIFSDHTDTRTHKREGILPKIFFSLLGRFFKIFENKYFKIISFSELGMSVISKKLNVPIRKFEIIPLGYDQDTFKFMSERKNSEEKFIIGFAGKITPQKRIDFLIKELSAAIFKDKVKLVIVGYSDDEYGKSLKKLALDMGLTAEFRPFADSVTLSHFYNYIDLAVYPGGISITTIEANGCGTPVLIFESIDGLAERTEEGRGLLFKSDGEFRMQLNRFIEMYEHGSIDNAHIESATRSKYSWAVIKGKYLKVYNQSLLYGKKS